MSTSLNTRATRKRMVAMLPRSLSSSDYVKTRLEKVRVILLRAVNQIIDGDIASFDDDLEIEVMNRMSETMCLLQQAILIDEHRESSKRARVRAPEPEQEAVAAQASGDSNYGTTLSVGINRSIQSVARGDTLNGRGLEFDRVAMAMRQEAARAIGESVEREEY